MFAAELGLSSGRCLQSHPGALPIGAGTSPSYCVSFDFQPIPQWNNQSLIPVIKALLSSSSCGYLESSLL